MQGKIQMTPGADMNALTDARDALRFKLGQLFKECFDICCVSLSQRYPSEGSTGAHEHGDKVSVLPICLNKGIMGLGI